ncbi:YlxQ family RNA-binding protein [Evansella cellulosilytica]|uniref:Ribosomal protein L7Ae/L30e/S12e/Gadd45 n=1 Tax=Evansella cellulosilytica (strain ATCC 21833 / DSM 2522 / FERM P-1141 / JCM 9156 / N-4) TaxID=649639 RepID=E6TSS2_EVAC2|nr:YlxQ family RNA-binding protein [Evansella cellulosilytica]ADU30714.1 ribosomal protein L7Ae/L30e/S12e/Gadd45 [Evansella cellulosilytica DSM 2522]
MNEEKWLQTLGLVTRARKLITGEELVIKSIQKQKSFFVIVSEDASQNTKKKVTDKCKYYNIPYAIKGNRESIGRAIGKEERVVIGIEDAGFARKMRSIIE